MIGNREKRDIGDAGLDPGIGEPIPVPVELPPLEGLDDEDEYAPHRRRGIWLRTLAPALVVVALVAFVAVAGLLGVFDGLKDRAVANQQEAEEHYQLGLAYLESGDYELAVAEFEEAARHNPNLPGLQARRLESRELAEAQVTPTSETRRDAAAGLYREAVALYERGELGQAIVALNELQGLDPDYARETTVTMLTTAHYQLGLDAVREDRLEEAAGHFQTVLDVEPDGSLAHDAQEQLNLLRLYLSALKRWDQDWAATIQALKGLYALAPDYKDVRGRLHDAYVFHALEYENVGDWCRAATEYGAAAQVFPLEATVDSRDDAAIRCQATAEAATATPTQGASARGTAPAPRTPTAGSGTTAASATALPPPVPSEGTPSPPPPVLAPGQGKIAFASYDSSRQRHDIYLFDMAAGSARLLRENASQPAFAPGNQRLAFRNVDPLHLGLGLIDLRTGEVTELTAHGEDSVPSWSPDAKQIVFASDKHGDRKWRIFVISPGAVRGEGEEWALGQMPAWSPTGDEIAYRGCDARGDNCSIWIMEPGGFSQVRLSTEASDTGPSWSPDGSQVAFASARVGNWELYVVDVVTGQERRLSDHPAMDVAPAWSPDGKQLAFLSNREGGWAVYVLEVKSGQVQKVISAGDAYPDPLSERLAWVP